ncbi:stalk domain-containing protein [Paenibacillus sp. YAF4_2]|uniref:stalk domain-containing protein n=1 Tax=Paenibacillus sp. YAF4_2 TaxID=3233085 RepID=UPI003F964FD1
MVETQVVIDNKPLQTDKHVILDGRKRFVPMRAALEQMGWKVDWKPDLITISKQTTDLLTALNLYLEDESMIRIINSTAYVEMYRLGEISDSEVKWDDASNTIVISSDVEDEEDEEEAERPELTDEESIKANYGKYEGSPTLDALSNIYSELEQEGYNAWNVLRFYPDYHHSGYFGTPLDVITFGRTGGDGDHYGFLTDFGAVTNLEEAPIVLVTPMNFDQPAVIVAENIREFLRIALIDSSMFYMEYANEEDYLKQRSEDMEGYVETDEERENRLIVRERLEKELKLPEISDPYTYSAQVRAERDAGILVPTEDLLGVTNVNPLDAGRKHETIELDEYIGLKELKAFLSNATYASKLALIRNYYFHLETYVYHEKGIEEAIVKEMKDLGLQDEWVRMNANRYVD